MPESEIMLITAATLAARALAIVAGMLVCLDSFKIMTGIEHPAHHPKGNALAWGLIAITAFAGSVAFIYIRQFSPTSAHSWTGQATTLGLWFGLSAGLVWRAAIRSFRPGLLFLSGAIFYLAGFGLSVAEALR